MNKKNIFFSIALSLCISAQAGELAALYNSLDPQSAAQALAFYELYPSSEEGQKALKRAANLFQTGSMQTAGHLTTLINRLKGKTEGFSKEDVALVEALASHLPNRRLKGYRAKNEAEVLALPTEEIDLGMALLLSQLSQDPQAFEQARAYSAMLDLMALQIVSRLPEKASFQEKIKETNRLIFNEMRFRFPPQSVYSQDIDLYTFLPSVMDNHLGVCLGVAALYLAVAQRLDLPLEIVTPPGHIYVRYNGPGGLINIETTARGVHVPSENYLGVNTRSLEMRTLKEVVGMTHVNQASAYLQSASYEKAVACYEKALPYMPGDLWVQELLGYSYLFVGRYEEGSKLLNLVANYVPEEAVVGRPTAADYLQGKVDVEGLKAVFMSVDETRQSILKKQKYLVEVLDKYPSFREGWQQLAVSWIQLNRKKEAIAALKQYHNLDPDEPTIEYYLSVLHGERQDYKSCWTFLKNAENITQKRNFSPKPLRELRRELIRHCPET